MKKVIKYMLVFIFLFFGLNFKTYADTVQGRVNATLSVRTGPGTNYPYASSEDLKTGTLITILDTVLTNDYSSKCGSGKWYKIQEVNGYVCSGFVNLISTQTEADFPTSLDSFPESYRSKIEYLHSIYPNAKFYAYNTELSWNDVIYYESVTINKNLIEDVSGNRDGLKNLNSYNYSTNSFTSYYTGWYAASKEAIEYNIDSRNFLDEKNVFMFESSQYTKPFQRKSGIDYIIGSKSFMTNAYVDGGNTYTYSDVIRLASSDNGVNAYHVAARMMQETGSGSRSALVKGQYASYPEYNGYYNFFNVGASGDNVVLNGLKSAYSRGWNNEYNAIYGGTGFLANNYIKVGYNSTYFQKFDVVCNVSPDSAPCYNNQYMQNVEAPIGEGSKIYYAYYKALGSEFKNQEYEFYIPIYTNMPTSTSKPSEASPINYLSSLTVNGDSVVDFSGLNQTYTVYTSNNVNSVNIQATALAANKGATVTGIGNINIPNSNNSINITVTAANGLTRIYTINVIKTDNIAMSLTDTISNIKSGLIKENNIFSLTNVDTITEKIKETNAVASVTIKDLAGNVVTTGSVGTGYKVNVTVGDDSKEFETVIYGDINGDTEITILDLLYVQKYLLKSLNLGNSNLIASDINRDGEVTILDLLYIQKHLLGSLTINQ